MKDQKTNNLKFDISKNDLFSKDFFFLIHVPKNSKFGFLIIQIKENHGVKSVFENAFNQFMLSKGVSSFYLEMKQAPPRYFIKNYLEFGKLKEFRLIGNDSETESKSSDINLGKEERIYKLNKSIVNDTILKGELINLFNNYSISDFQKITFLNKGDFDEIVFILNLNGKSKTFYIKNKEKIRSNVDVSKLIEIEDGEPTIESLVKISLEIIESAA